MISSSIQAMPLNASASSLIDNMRDAENVTQRSRFRDTLNIRLAVSLQDIVTEQEN